MIHFFTFHFFLMIGKIYISRDIYDFAWSFGIFSETCTAFCLSRLELCFILITLIFLFIKHIWCIYNAMKRIKLIYRFRIGDASSFHMNWLKNFVQRVIKRKLPIDTFIRYFKTLDIKIVLLSACGVLEIRIKNLHDEKLTA